jgi:hypothetical protein
MDDFRGLLPNRAPLQDFLSTVAEAAAERALFHEFLSSANQAGEELWASFLQVWRTLLISLAVVVLFCRLFGTHRALRWPMFWFISFLMAFDLLLYLGVRALLWFMEWCAFGMRWQRAVLWRTTTYAEWRKSAEAQDRAEGREAWRSAPKADEYDWRHIEQLTNGLASMRRAEDAAGLMRVLHHALKPNVGGIHEEALYRKARAGTKLLLEGFIQEVGDSVRALAEISAGAPDEALRTRAFLDAHIAYWGRAALVRPAPSRQRTCSSIPLVVPFPFPHPTHAHEAPTGHPRRTRRPPCSSSAPLPPPRPFARASAALLPHQLSPRSTSVCAPSRC